MDFLDAYSFTPVTGALLLTATEVLADVSAKDGNTFGAVLGYNALALELQKVLNADGNGLALTNAYWNAMTNLTHAVIGVSFYGETLSQAQIAGILLVTAGIVLLGYK